MGDFFGQRAAERKRIKEENIQRLTTEHSEYFTEHHNLKFVRRLGEGTGAIALLFKETKKTEVDGKTKTIRRKVVVKVAFSEYKQRDKEADAELENERKWLKQLEGAQHIIRLLAFEVDKTKVSRPATVLEYAENGDIHGFYEKAAEEEMNVPNRVLWSMFLCLIRACVGLAYPPWKDGELEEIPEDESKKPSSIMHNDIHDENVLLGDVMPNSEEHWLTPILKLIDFGKTIMMPPQGGETAEGDNIYNVARVITGCAVLDYNTLADVNMEVEIPDKDGNVRKMLVYTDSELKDSEYLHPDLKNLLMLCQTAKNSDRPSLQYVLKICEDAVKTHTAENYNDIPDYDSSLETDRSIRAFIQNVVYNA